MKMWAAALETWNGAGVRWLGMSAPTAERSQQPGDKRFETPEWRTDLLCRTIKNMIAGEVLVKMTSRAKREAAEADLPNVA